MRILVIEDDTDFVDVLSEIIIKEASDYTLTVRSHLSGAMHEIKNHFFDLIIVDLNIPLGEGTLDGNPTHGHSVFRTAREEAAGTPVILLTGSSAEDFIESLTETCEKKDIWGSGVAIPLVAFHAKHKLDSFPPKLRTYTENIRALKGIELQRNGIALSEEEDRILRIFSRSVNGVIGSITSIGGGLSESKVFRLVVTRENGSVVHDAICKVGRCEFIRDEVQRYDRHISRLKPEATPRKIAVHEHGAKNIAGVFYNLANGFVQNAFTPKVMGTMSSSLIPSLEALLENWQEDTQRRVSIAEIRRRIVSDETMAMLSTRFDLNWTTDFESQEIQVHWGCAHGDMHGLNILVSEDGDPTLIDYGDTAEGPSSLDPITLEFSTFFHPEGPLKDESWPTEEQAQNWGDIDTYLENCPYPDFVTSCRDWSIRSAAGHREIAVVGYGYFLRQLKYEGTNHRLAMLFLDGTRKYYAKT